MRHRKSNNVHSKKTNSYPLVQNLAKDLVTHLHSLRLFSEPFGSQYEWDTLFVIASLYFSLIQPMVHHSDKVLKKIIRDHCTDNGNTVMLQSVVKFLVLLSVEKPINFAHTLHVECAARSTDIILELVNFVREVYFSLLIYRDF